MIATACTAWHYVVNRIAVHTARLASVTVTLKDTLPNLSPLTCAAIVFECAHQ